MRLSQLVALVLVFGLTLSFDVSAKPSWKDVGSTTEKPGGKKNKDTSTDPVTDTTTDTTTTDPVSDTTTEPTVTGTATLTWDIPESRENGNYLAISELNGYKVLVRDITNDIEYFVMITDPNITQWDFADLTSGEWEFSIASIDTLGVYSSYSPTISKNIN